MPANPIIIFDIETGPLPRPELVIPPFDPSQVKLGNIKNPDLIAEKIQKAEENHVTDYIKNAALDALSGQVLCIGYKVPGEKARVLCADADGEKEMLVQWWKIVAGFERQPRLVGFNTKAFDLPFLYKRSWKHRVTPPYWLRHGRYWNDLILDLREIWQLGDNRAHGSLAAICRHLNLGEKSGSGADFSDLWLRDREAAIAYALQDVELTQKVHDVLCPELY
jgi:uncharacterized protein YprB with RNaseH-like and TPR domain